MCEVDLLFDFWSLRCLLLSFYFFPSLFISIPFHSILYFIVTFE